MNKSPFTYTSEKAPLLFSGIFLFISGFIVFMGIITSEMLYTLDFTTRNNYISELASALPQGTPTPQPSGIIFNASMIISGLMIMISALFCFIAGRRLLSSILIFLFGIGFLGVGIFPGDVAPWHGIFANVIFIAGGLGAILSFRIVRAPLSYIFIFLGMVSLIFLFFYNHFVPLMGVGGAERWVFYPQVFWITGLGAYFLGLRTK